MPEDKSGTLTGADIFGEGAQAAKNDPEPEEKSDPDAQAQPDGDPGRDQAAGQDQGDKLLAGKYKTVEELERAYSESQKWGTKSAQDAASLRRELEEMRKVLAPQQTAKQQEEWKKRAQDAVNRAVVDEDPEALFRLIAGMAGEIAERKLQQRDTDLEAVKAQAKFQRQVDAFLAENPEAAGHVGDMVKLLEAEPELVTRPNWLDRAYTRVLSRKMGLTARARAEADARTQAEKQAAGMPGGAARKTQETESEADKIKKGIFGDPARKRGIFDD